MADSLNGEFSEGTAESDSESFDESEGELLLRSVFESCDVNADGSVKVSTLVDHLLKEVAADDNPKILSYLDELAIILDPSGEDILIDKDMYNQGIRRWIQDVQARSSFHDLEDEGDAKLKGGDEPGSPGVVYRGRGEGDQNLNSLLTGYPERSLENRSFYSSETSNEWEKSQSEILGRIQDLQITNKKLIEEKAKLRSQMDNTEEMNSALLHEMKDMRNKLSRYDQLLEKNKSLEKDYEVLKNTVNECQTSREEFANRASQLEKENLILQGTIEDYQKSDLTRNATLETIRGENRELLQKLNEQKQLYVDLEVLQDFKQKMVDESSSKSEYMTSFIAELSMANEALKAEKCRLEVDLLESKHEISKLTAMRSPSSVGYREPIYASTPFHSDAPVSLHQEMGAEMTSGNHSSSSRDRSGHLNFTDSHESRNNTHESNQSDISVSTAASSDKYSSVAQQIALSFKKKKDLALKQIAELAAIESNSEAAPNPKALMKTWEEGLDSFANEVEGLAAAKQQAEKRSAKLLESLEILKAENKKLVESREQSLQKVGGISTSSEEMDRRVDDLTESIRKEREVVEELKMKNGKLKEQLIEEKEKYSKLRQECDDFKKTKSASFENGFEEDSEAEDESTQQIKELKELVTDLEERIHDYTRRLFELEEVLEVKEKIISQHQTDKVRLKKTNSETVAKHESNLREILEMFSLPGDMMPEVEVLNPPSITLLKDKFERYMAGIKSKLQNMSVRDGPIGSEGNDTPNAGFNETRTVASFPDRHFELGSKINEELNAQINSKSCISVYCQTDLGMHEVGEAIHALRMLKALQDPVDVTMDVDYGSDRQADCFESNNEFNGISNPPEIYTEINEGTESVEKFKELPRDDGFIATRDNSKSENESCLESKYSSQNNDANRMPGLKEMYSGNGVAEEDVNFFDELILNKPAEPIDHRILKGTVNDSDNRSEPKPLESNSANIIEERVETADKSNSKRTFKDRETSRKLLRRSESVSTDESNTSDEMVIEFPDNERKLSTKSEDSVAPSEISTVSTTSKRARRIGVSAEPVRLPTWTELRESIKLNQQIFLEEEMSDKIGSMKEMKTPKNSIESSCSNKVCEEVTGDIACGDDLLNKSAGMESSDPADTSMEWWYEVPKDQQNQGVESVAVQSKREVISFTVPQGKTSTSSSVHSIAESIQTLKSNDSELGNGPNTAVESSKTSASEEKGSESSLERQDTLGPLKNSSTMANEEQHPSIVQLEKELEKQYNTVVLSFKTDQYTLQRRLEKQERARDVAESGMEREIRKLAENLQAAEKLAVTLELRQIMTNLQSHTDILRKAGMKVSAQAEQHGCFQQESKAAPTIESVINYAEHLQLCLERSKEADEIRSKEIIPDSRNSTRNESNHVQQKYGYCEKCQGTLPYGNSNAVKENCFSDEEKRTKSNSLTFFGLASSILREKERVIQKGQGPDVLTKDYGYDKQDFSAAKPDGINYAPNENASESKTVVRSHRSRSCECFGTVIRFLLSVAILSAMLLVFAKYVEVDLNLLNKNWNDKLAMYGKKFFSSGKKNAV